MRDVGAYARASLMRAMGLGPQEAWPPRAVLPRASPPVPTQPIVRPDAAGGICYNVVYQRTQLLKLTKLTSPVTLPI